MRKIILLFLLAITLCLCSGCQELCPTSTPVLGDTLTRTSDGMVVVYAPAGEFQMGNAEGYGDEKPVHTVYLDGFWIDQTEVTNEQFAAFLNEEGNQEEGGAPWLNIDDEECLIEQVGGEYRPKSGYAEHPVVQVKWFGAAAYCEWAGARLPTEAEAEYAARGPESLMFPWGDEFDCALCNSWRDGCDGYIRTAPVGSFPDGASWCGAHDMVGNVAEWVADWYDPNYYADSPPQNPTGPSSGMWRVLRAGSWYLPEHAVTSRAYRGHDLPFLSYGFLGFRCARGSQ